LGHRPFTLAESVVGGVPPLPETTIQSRFGLALVHIWRSVATFYLPALGSRHSEIATSLSQPPSLSVGGSMIIDALPRR
jgi:hypothetical protein